MTEDEIKKQQAQRWNASSTGIEKWLPILEKAAHNITASMIEEAHVTIGNVVLDLATGIGDPAIALGEVVKPNGRVTAVDFAPQRLAIARKRSKERGLENVIDFIMSDIEQFAFPKLKYDAIFCRWGLMFVTDLDRLLSKVRNALGSNGAFVAAVWPSIEKVPIMKIPLDTLDSLRVPRLPSSADPFSLSDLSKLTNLLSSARFHHITTASVPVIHQFDSADQYVDYIFETNTGLKERIAASSIPLINGEKGVRAAMVDAAKSYSDTKGSLRLENETILISGRV